MTEPRADNDVGTMPAPPELAKDEIAFGFRPGKDRTMNERRPMVAGNWKMYTKARRGPGQGTILVQDTEPLIVNVWDEVEVVFAPPFTGLYPLSTLIELDKPHIKLGAQDVYWEDEGAFTGEVSPSMLADLGVSYVVVGHSERRQYFGETNETVNKKAKALLAEGLKPIICVGENSGKTSRLL